MIPKRHYNITVQGKVQGVWFRKYVDKIASNMGSFGFVKNLDNGSVYIEVECNPWDFQLFIAHIEKGSPLSKVTNIDWEEGKLKNFTFFEIRR